jgi:hypothetical protein
MPRRGCDRFARYLLQTLLFLGLAMSIGYVHAQSSAVQWTEFQIERGEDGLYLNAALAFELPGSLEDALTRGMPVNFVLQATLMRERWYWYDKRISQTEKINRWKMAELSVLNTDAKQKLDIQFNLDLSQLPQALQFGNLVTNDWALELRQSQRLDDLGK